MDLFVYQQYADLHCLSAYEAIQQFMKQDACKRLRRFVHWTMRADTSVSVDDFVSSIMSQTYYLCNPNKEAVHIGQIPKLESPYESVLVDVSNDLVPESTDIRTKINEACGVNIHSLQKRIVWECFVDRPNYEDAVSFVEDYLLCVKSYEKGILVNPIYETYRILDPKTFYSVQPSCHQSVS